VNNQAPELSPEARRLIDEARGADDPTSEDHARVKARWLASVAAVAGVSSLTEAARAAGGIGWGFKAAGAALVIAAGAIGLSFTLDSNDEAQKPASLPGWSGSSPERFQKTPRALAESGQPPQAAAPKPSMADSPLSPPSAERTAIEPSALEPAEPPAAEAAAPSGAGLPSAPEAPGAPSSEEASGEAVSRGTSRPAVSLPQGGVRARPVARAVAARSSVPKVSEKKAASAVPAPVDAAPAAAGPSGQLSEELALLSDVRGSIQEGAATRALELLNRYESRFGQPILGMEADALRVDALCKAGRRDAARESARAFQNEWPGSPLERRVSAACP
jgi:hypothetical protein